MRKFKNIDDIIPYQNDWFRSFMTNDWYYVLLESINDEFVMDRLFYNHFRIYREIENMLDNN